MDMDMDMDMHSTAHVHVMLRMCMEARSEFRELRAFLFDVWAMKPRVTATVFEWCKQAGGSEL